MTIGERVRGLIRLRGTSWGRVSMDCKLGENQLQYWSKEGNYPNGQTIIKLCEYFGVSADYLLFGKENGTTVQNNGEMSNSILAVSSSNISMGTHVTPQEMELINLYRKASLKTQIQVLNILTDNAE